MSTSIKVRGAIVLLCLVFSFVALAPTFIGESLPEVWKKSFDPIHLGLDLQGGMHLVLGVEVDKAVESSIDSLSDDIETLLTEKDIVYRRLERRGIDQLVVTVYDQQAGAQVDALITEQFGNLEPAGNETVGDFIEKGYRFSTAEVDEIRESAIRQALETLRNRVDQFGVSEPLLQRQTGNRILIQLPGLKDPERAIALIGTTARLEFRMVRDDVDPQAALRGELPAGTEVLYEKRVDRRSGAESEIPMVVESRSSLGGDQLADARVRINTSRFNEPYVFIKFDAVGSKRFEQLTAANVGKRMAIVLDDTIYSAPVINERIAGGDAMISGSFTEKEAADLSIVLRAGALPAPIKVLEERTVGPSLGKDSIDKGVFSALIGGLLLLAAMALYYRWSGWVANFALALNLVFILALLSLFKATLTLPGIAGIVLTTGMAVDANVLIFERIREELRLGKNPRAAVESGFGKAFLTIIDANITTLIAALVLFQFGTGPVKGFAVTLSVGIVSTLFTAVFISRSIFDFFVDSRNVKRLSV